MHVIMLMVLFNVFTGENGDYVVQKVYPEGAIKQCAKDLIGQPASKPDKNGNVKLYECLVQGTKPTVKLIGM